MKATATTTQTPFGTELMICLPPSGSDTKGTKIRLNFQPSQADLLFAVQKALLENQTGVITNNEQK
jgi:hypothetical protein